MRKSNRFKNHEKIFFKFSGSWVSKQLLDLITQSRKPGEALQVWLPNKVVIYNDDNSKRNHKDELIFDNFEDYGRNFYSSLLDAEEIISYPSEMVQVIASLMRKAWWGRFVVLPPVGAYGKRNLNWLMNFFSLQIEGELYVFDFFQAEEEEITNLLSSLGKESLVSVIEKKRVSYWFGG